MAINKEYWGDDHNGEPVYLFHFTNKNGLRAGITSYGARLVYLQVPDKNGKLENITLGYSSLTGYLKDTAYMGCVAGRFANRIANGRFQINGTWFQLNQNNDGNHLHGGPEGFHRKNWETAIIHHQHNELLQCSYNSKDGEENYPGNLHITVQISLTDNDELKIVYHAVTDTATIINLTYHPYFNLSGNFSNNIFNHQLKIDADCFLPVTPSKIPTGELKPVTDTVFDFTKTKTIGTDIESGGSQLADANGYDHCWVLNKKGEELKLAAIASEPVSGRAMKVYTTKPGMQLYTGNFLPAPFQPHTGFCLEAQYLPDAPNHAHFSNSVLLTGEEYNHTTIYRFERMQ